MDEDRTSWQQVTTGVIPLEKGRKLPPEVPPAPPRRRRVHPAPDRPAPPPCSSPVPAIERSLLTRIARERLPIEARLDLHGMTEGEAEQRLVVFVQHCYAGGIRTALVITGKGRGSEGVLRRAFTRWLETEALRGYVAGCHAASPAHGGSGAWYLRLRTPPGRDGAA